MRTFAVLTSIVACFTGLAMAQGENAPNHNLPSAWSAASTLVSSVTIQKKVQEVSLILSVTDRKGRFVDNLRKDDLTVFDNATQQRMLTFFQSQSDLPLDVVILIDVSSSVASRLEAEQKTIRAFTKKIARPSDAVTVIAFNQNVQLVTPVTGNWNKIFRRIKNLKADGETALFDAVETATKSLARNARPARRIIILLSDGQENSSHINIDQTITQVLKSESSVYSVNVDENKISDQGKWGEAVLRHLADATGGIYLKSDHDGDVYSAFGRIKRELRSQYALAYRPSNLVGEAFHRIQVMVPGSLRVRCRGGYYEK